MRRFIFARITVPPLVGVLACLFTGFLFTSPCGSAAEPLLRSRRDDFQDPLLAGLQPIAL
jgi:hypothetical protein